MLINKHLAALVLIVVSLTILQAQSDAFAPGDYGSDSSYLSRALISGGSIGVGGGSQYGVLPGINGEMYLGSHFSMFGSLGSAFIDERFEDVLSYEIGTRFYLYLHDKSWRPRISLFWGTNSTLHGVDYNDYPWTKLCSGLGIAVGNQIAFGSKRQFAVDFDISLPIYSEALRLSEMYEDHGYDDIYINNDGLAPLYLLSLGLRYNFGSVARNADYGGL